MLAYEFPDAVCLRQVLKGIIAWVLEVDVVVSWGPFHKLEKMAILQDAKLGVIL